MPIVTLVMMVGFHMVSLMLRIALGLLGGAATAGREV